MYIECWKFINSFAPWFSALGSLSAVALSLYLALSGRKIYINISSEIYEFDKGNDLLIIKITNTGLRTVVIDDQSCIYFQIGRFKKKKCIGIGPSYIDIEKSSTFPCRLTEGETLNLIINIYNANGNWLHNFKKNNLINFPISTLRIIVYPNASKPIKEKVGNSIINELKKNNS